MSVETLDSSFDVDSDIENDADSSFFPKADCTDARRLLEDKLEDLRLRRDMKEFDFDSF